MSELTDLYQEVILDHNKRPRNFHPMEDAHHHAEGFNPLCGDKVTVFLKMDNDRISDISFTGKGCAISTASASIMTDALKGKTVEEAQNLFDRFHNAVTGQNEDDSGEGLGKLAVLTGVKEFPMRVKCATLAWHTLHAAMMDRKEPITTEDDQ